MKKCNNIANEVSERFGKRRVVGALALILCAMFGGAVAVDTYADAPTLTLSVDTDSLSLNLVPNKDNGVFASSDTMNIGVTSSASGGYVIGIKADTGGSSSLVNTAPGSNATLDSISEAISEANFSADSTAAAAFNGKWGYMPSMYNSVANTNYLPTPSTAGHIIDSQDNATGTHNYTLKIGARAGLDTAIGTYEGTYIITAIVNSVCNPNATTIWEAVCMQDMNSYVANSMETDKQYVLKDSRDEKNYYITKTKDGRVWMTQNLDYDISTTGVTSEKTDLNVATGIYTDGYAVDSTTGIITWTPERATSSAWVSSYNDPYSYDNGEIYYYTDTSGVSTTYTTKSACEAAHSVEECAHNHSGNYYNFSAAVASNDTSGITSGVASNSICPKGWRLPDNSIQYGDANQTWRAEGIMVGMITAAEHYGLYTTGGYTKISNAPLYLTRTGFRNNGNAPQKTGTNGYFRTAQVQDATYAWTYYFTSVYPYPYERYASTDDIWFTRAFQAPVRCVARQDNTGSTTVVFNKNNTEATGAVASQTITNGGNAVLNANQFTLSGYAFNGWNTAADGSGVNYADASRFDAEVGIGAETVTLYAQWVPAHTLTITAGENLQVGVVSNDNGVVSSWSDSTTRIVGEGQKIAIKAKDNTTGTVFDNWTIETGTGSFLGTVWRSASTKTTTIVMGSSDMTVKANGTTTYKTIADNSVTMQQITACPDWLDNNVHTITDSRDGATYHVAKLADDKCWMLDNMMLGSNDNAIALTPNDTNIASNWELPKGVTSSFNAYASPKINAAYKGDTAPTRYGTDRGDGKVGVYYNYCAASAGEVCTAGDNATDTTHDICPKNWRMPTGGTADRTTGFGEYQALSNIINNQANYKAALSLPLSGYFDSATQYNLGSFGYWWSSTFNGGLISYSLHAYSSGVYPAYYIYRIYGFSMRCVLGGE